MSSQYPNIGLSIFDGGNGSDLNTGLGSDSVSYSSESPGLRLGWVSGSGSGSISDSELACLLFPSSWGIGDDTKLKKTKYLQHSLMQKVLKTTFLKFFRCLQSSELKSIFYWYPVGAKQCRDNSNCGIKHLSSNFKMPTFQGQLIEK